MRPSSACVSDVSSRFNRAAMRDQVPGLLGWDVSTPERWNLWCRLVDGFSPDRHWLSPLGKLLDVMSGRTDLQNVEKWLDASVELTCRNEKITIESLTQICEVAR